MNNTKYKIHIPSLLIGIFLLLFCCWLFMDSNQNNELNTFVLIFLSLFIFFGLYNLLIGFGFIKGRDWLNRNINNTITENKVENNDDTKWTIRGLIELEETLKKWIKTKKDK